VVHPDLVDHVLHHYNTVWDLPSVAEGARASAIGTVTGDGIYRLLHRGQTVCEARSIDLTSGLQYVRPTEAANIERTEPAIECPEDRITIANCKLQRGKSSTKPEQDLQSAICNLPQTFTISEVFESMLRHPNGCSREPILKHYDKTVIGNTIIEAGEADAGVITPLQDLSSHVHDGEHPGWELPDEDRKVGVAVAADSNGRYGRISPYWQGANAAIESMRNVAATGATPRALTDCLNFGNPEIPTHLWAYAEGVRGIAEAARGATVEDAPVPIISGNVSLYNSTPDGSAIDPTAVVCCIGVLPDASRAINAQWKKAGSVLLHIGTIRDECGGSLYYQLLEEMTDSTRNALLGCNVPSPDFAQVSREIQFVTEAIQHGRVHSCHDISDGGLLIALFEMSVPLRRNKTVLGADITLDVLPALRSDQLLFSQSGGFILEVDSGQVPTLQKQAQNLGIACTPIGIVTDTPQLNIQRLATDLLSIDLLKMQDMWRKALSEHLM
jgi:phosphoribosylformylglycinamidine synthase